ncbi:MAG: isocitrate dehydrogenase (NADP(+)) [Deltaproteobacteria bacterium]|nr:isocitrate dehydrogenase (NADP(+)) [Deltaproteobacteria bacterium]
MSGEKITVQDGRLQIPDRPIIPFIEGDGIGPDIWRASQMVFDEAVRKTFGGKRQIVWKEILAGEKAFKETGNWLPVETTDAIKEYLVSIKGPLTTPVGGGFRSLNVALRQILDLFACVRPVRYFDGVPSPVKAPHKLNVVIYRENTEDVYAGIEYEQGTDKAKKLIEFLNATYGTSIRVDSGVGIKPISVFGSRRLVRKAIRHAIDKKRGSVTLVHKGNIMKFTEGAFRSWGYDEARENFGEFTVTEDQVWSDFGGKTPAGKVMMKDRIADAMFQQVLLRPDEYEVLATPNLNGDYLSDACAAQVGGLGMAPGANMSDDVALFEATHGTAPKYAGQDKVNPGSVILSGCMMFEYMGWDEVSQAIQRGIEGAIAQKTVTYDLARQMPGATEVSCSGFGEAICKNL